MHSNRRASRRWAELDNSGGEYDEESCHFQCELHAVLHNHTPDLTGHCLWIVAIVSAIVLELKYSAVLHQIHRK